MRRRILLVSAGDSERSLISTYLGTMGCECTAVATAAETIELLERQAFDAVLLDLGQPDFPGQHLVRIIQETQPELSGRILAITNEPRELSTVMLVRCYRLIEVPRDRLFAQLWNCLEGAFAPQRMRETTPGRLQIAQMVFDSFRAPVPEGARAMRRGVRQLVFEYENAMVDIVIEPLIASGRVALMGQLLDTQVHGGGNDALPVMLISAGRLVAHATTNHFGEFNLECEILRGLDLEIRLGKGFWVSLPLGDMG